MVSLVTSEIGVGDFRGSNRLAAPLADGARDSRSLNAPLIQKNVTFHVNFHPGKFHCEWSKGKK